MLRLVNSRALKSPKILYPSQNKHNIFSNKKPAEIPRPQAGLVLFICAYCLPPYSFEIFRPKSSLPSFLVVFPQETPP